MTENKKAVAGHSLLRTVSAAVLLGALFSMKMMATGLVYVGIFLLFWVPYSLYVIIRKPDRRKVQSLKIGIWVLMIVAVLAIHQVRKVYTRDFADSVVQKIELFRKQEGRYPDSLEEAGFRSQEIRSKLSMAHYANKPAFYYADTVMIFHMWRYDFDK